MSFLNQRGVFLQMMLPSQSEPNTIVSMQLARKELGWDAEEQLSTESLVDSIYVVAVSSDVASRSPSAPIRRMWTATAILIVMTRPSWRHWPRLM